MLKLKFLNSKEVKAIEALVKHQWGARLPDIAFLLNSSNKIHIISRDISKLDLVNLRVNSAGLYFGELFDDSVRLSVEGSQILGPHAIRNVAEVTELEMRDWLRGEDIMREFDGCSGFVILKHGNDFIGCGRYANQRIKNFIPKTRRIKSSAQGCKPCRGF